MSKKNHDHDERSISGTSSQLYGYLLPLRNTNLVEMSKSGRPSVQEIADWFAAWRKLLVNGLIIFALILIIPLTINQMFRTQVVLEPIGMPKLLTEMGYSGDVAAHRLWDAVETINDRAATARQRLTLRPESRQLDIAIPETTVSFKSVGQLLRRLFSSYDTRIAGEFVCVANPCEQQDLMLRLRIFKKTLTIVRMGPLGSQSSDDYFHKSALKLVEAIDPYVAASFHLANGEFSAARRVAEKILLTDSSDVQWAHNLLGIIKMETADLDDAIRHFQLALDRASDFILPRLNWAVALARKGDRPRAIEQLQLAQSIDADRPDIYVIWGRVLAEEKKFDDAIVQLRKAIKLDPNHTGGLVYLSIALARKGKFADAVAHLENATTLDHNRAEVQAAWGAVLYFKGDYAGALEKLHIGLDHAVHGLTKQRILKLRRLISDKFFNGQLGS